MRAPRTVRRPSTPAVETTLQPSVCVRRGMYVKVFALRRCQDVASQQQLATGEGFHCLKKNSPVKRY